MVNLPNVSSDHGDLLSDGCIPSGNLLQCGGLPYRRLSVADEERYFFTRIEFANIEEFKVQRKNFPDLQTFIFKDASISCKLFAKQSEWSDVTIFINGKECVEMKV